MGLLGDWLPEDPDKNAAARQALISMGISMMRGRGNFGEILGDGLGNASAAYNGTLQQQKDRMEQAQLNILQNKDAREQRLNSFLATAFGDPSDDQSTPPPNASSAFIQGTAAGSGAGAPWRPGYGSSSSVFPYGAAPESPMPGGGGITGADIRPLSSLPRKLGPGEASRDIPPARARTGGRFPMTLNQVAMLKGMGGPDLMDAYKVAHEGFERKQGSTYLMPDGSERSYARLDPGQVQNQDGSISNATGYVSSVVEAEDAKARAQESAKADYDLLPVTYIGESGRPIGGTRGAYIRSVRDLPKKGDRPTAPPTRTQGPANFPTISPEEQQSRDEDRLHILRTELSAARNPRDIVAIQREIASVTRALGRSPGAGSAGGAPRLQSPAEARAQMGAVDTNVKVGQDLNSNWIKEIHNPVQAEGKAARATLGQLATLQNIDFKSGWGAQTRAAASAMLGALGIKDAGRYATSAQQFQQVAMERNMTMLQAQTGPQTDGDSERAQQTFVRLANTPQANQYIADLTGANARIALRKAEYYNKALPLARERGDLTEIDRRWSAIAPSVWDDPALQKYKVK